MPHNDPPDHLFDSRPPQGAFMVIEVEFMDALYQRVQERRIPIQEELRDQTWGHRSFCVRELNGLTLYLFHEGRVDSWVMQSHFGPEAELTVKRGVEFPRRKRLLIPLTKEEAEGRLEL